MDNMPHWMKVLVQTLGELAFALVALPLYIFLVLPKHDGEGFPGFVPLIAEGVSPFLAVALAAIALIAGVGVAIALVRIFGRDRIITDEIDFLADGFTMFDLVPVYAAAGFAEEFLFRVVCVDLCGLVIASILFTAAHFSYWKHPLLLADVFAIALLFGSLYLFTQSLLLCALVHFAYNLEITHLVKSGFMTRVSKG